ncbi:MAG: carboxypeptidase regulatory-like domain-containing protein [Thermoanaerobaculum sp.]|nr:carboxypeptidase regulatory-like domain-containing protein [Thermoanaerobaculum sp.]
MVEADQRRPIASAKVRILGDGGPEVTTDASGAFTLAGLCHGFATLTVSAEGYTPLTLPVRRQDKVVVALRPSKVVKGRVLGLPPGRGAQLWVLGSTPWVVDVDETGGFFLGAGVPEEFSWIVRSPGFAPCSGRSRLPSQGELVLDCGGGNLTLRGRLVAPQAQGVKGRVLVLEGTEGEARRSHTTVGEDGSFAFTNLPAGTYRLITLMGQGVPLPVTLWQGSLSHDLRLELSLPAVPHPQAP